MNTTLNGLWNHMMAIRMSFAMLLGLLLLWLVGVDLNTLAFVGFPLAITTAFPSSAKQELLLATHNFNSAAGNTFKIALIKTAPTGTYGAASTNYSNVTGNSDEVASGGGYTTGGNTLTNNGVTLSSTTAFVDFADSSWTSATFSTTGCMIYNSSASNKAVYVGDFGGTQTVSAGTLTVVFPTPDATNAILRLA